MKKLFQLLKRFIKWIANIPLYDIATFLLFASVVLSIFKPVNWGFLVTLLLYILVSEVIELRKIAAGANANTAPQSKDSKTDK